MKTSFLLLALVFSIQAAFAGQAGEPANSLLSAEKVEEYPENGFLIIHGPKYRYGGKELNLLAFSAADNSIMSEYVCEAFNASKGPGSYKIKFYNFYSFFKEGVLMSYALKGEIKTQSGYYAPIKEIKCYY